jgi:DNA-binding transcriptional ArsR family regulator
MNSLTTRSTPANLDAIFSALADPTRRSILSRLTDGQATVGELTEPFDVSQPAISKHLKVLERAGLIERKVDEQRRPAQLKADNLAEAVNWLETFREFWETSFDQLDVVLMHMQQEEQ